MEFKNEYNEEELEINLEEEPEITPEPEPKVEEKPAETLEARKARLERQLEQTNKKLGVTVEKEPQTSKSDSLGYGEKAYLVANGIKGDEMKLVDEALKKTGDSIEDILANPYFQAKLEETRNLAKTADASPKGNRSSTMPTDSVEYWMGKPMEEVPHEMRIKVVKAKLDKEKNAGVFYNS
jgi:hypothetical protein